MEINHFAHEHPLILQDAPEFEDQRMMLKMCVACYKELSEGEAVYRCGQCESYFLHKACAEVPREIMHPYHCQHPLVLVSDQEVPCSVCLTIYRFGPFRYYCSLCEFALHPACAVKDNYILCASKDRHLRHKGHDQHHHGGSLPLLILQPRQALIFCDACGLEKKDQFYTCPSCPFTIHRSCALLPETNKCKAHNDSCDLTLSYGFPSHHKKFQYDCDVCHKKIYDWCWIYYCSPCRYFVHLGCITTTHEIKDDLDDWKKYDDLLHLPAFDLSQELIGRFLLKENTNYASQADPDIQPSAAEILIEHFGHEQHPLMLFQELPSDYDIEEDEEILCDCCIEPITISSSAADDHDHPYNYYYSCVECSYFLHLSCAKLPKQLLLDHTSHHHPLTLGCHQKFYDTFQCHKCNKYSNGFFFKCDTCNFYLDIKCAAMPTIIEHKNHKHPLIQSHSPSFEDCNACGSSVYRNRDFNCEYCQFYLHYECAMLPLAIRHRWDPHPLPLRFPPYKDHPDIFICDICEEEMHPKRWLYHCSKCDNSFHTDCVPKLETGKNIKFGGIFEVSTHPHPLKFVRKPTLKEDCNHCGGRFYSWRSTAFECGDCNFCLCVECIRKMS